MNSTDAKREKNRQSARQSRKRKSLYLDLLEAKVARLSGELSEISKEVSSGGTVRLAGNLKDAVSGCLCVLLPDQLVSDVLDRLGNTGKVHWSSSEDLGAYSSVQEDVSMLASSVSHIFRWVHGELR